jgi:hypothetical protein
MISKTAIARKVLALIEAGNMKEAAANLSDDFMFTWLVPEPMNRKQFLGFMKELLTAFPHWSFNGSHYREEGDTVRMKFYMMGMNSGPLDIPSFGLTALPATNRNVVLPVESADAVVKDDQMTGLTITVVPGGDIQGILKQLGLEEKVGKH